MEYSACHRIIDSLQCRESGGVDGPIPPAPDIPVEPDQSGNMGLHPELHNMMTKNKQV